MLAYLSNILISTLGSLDNCCYIGFHEALFMFVSVCAEGVERE